MEDRERMNVDVLFVGGGPACLAGALHLMQIIETHNKAVESGTADGPPLDEIMVVLIEKGTEVGAHGLSGAILDPHTLRELVPDYRERKAPIEHVVQKESLYYLFPKYKIRVPFTPGPLDNRGAYVISLSRFNRWLAGLAAEKGCELFPGFPGAEVLYDGDRVIGVRTGDKGVDKEGNRKGNFEPGVDLMAKVTIFGEGPRGSLAKQMIPKLGLDAGQEPMSYLTGVKEVWELPEGQEHLNQVIHTLGYPMPSDTYGGGAIYPMSGNQIALSVLAGLNAPDPFLDSHERFQMFKQHPFVRALIGEAKLVEYGAKTVSIGGYFSMPRLAFDGGMLVGDTAGIFDSRRIKGIHLSMRSGMLAAEAALEALLRGDTSRAVLSTYEESLKESEAGRDLWRARNFHQGFDHGIMTGLLNAGYGMLTGGKALANWEEGRADYQRMQQVGPYHGSEEPKEPPVFDGEKTFDKVTDVFHSGTKHNEDQPCHLHVEDLSICHGRCRVEYQNPCEKFCPAGVYEMVEDEDGGEKKLRINFANCVHCKTCDIRDPYGIINWVPPEGGDGPKYTVM